MSLFSFSVTHGDAHSKLVMLETTNSILNGSLYDSATPKALLAWHRVRLANWLATGGEQWAGYIAEYNSGKGEGRRNGRGYEKGCGHPLCRDLQ